MRAGFNVKGNSDEIGRYSACFETSKTDDYLKDSTTVEFWLTRPGYAVQSFRNLAHPTYILSFA